MKTIILLLTIIFTISLFSCNSIVIKDDIERIKYFKDNRTGLCFATVVDYSGNTHTYACITYVPCDSVQLYLKAE